MRSFPLEERYETLRIERSGRLLTIVMNRPASLNAADALLHEELAHVFYDVASDPDSDVIVLTGAGRAFSAGGDIPWMQDAIDTPEMFEQTAREAKRIVFSMLDLEKPLIAKVNGHATGLGATLALFCDVVFASEDAKIGDPHVSIGFVAGDGGPAIWPQLIGFHRAKEYLMTGELLPARKAAEIGLINHAVPAAELDAAVDAFTSKLLNGATKAIRWSKTVTNLELKRIVHAIMDASVSYEAQSNRTADHQEAVTAFRDKRKPVFRGR
ncbi:enoyl-CoA hydratase/isomerase family protein [Azospirillum sp. RWY-5-1]|uniref:Enoyl-CoA hydratase/isomerase family protein n=1 Tax=Azospirillum oleiclasticum TaxID=2735135 RepID=A0ABX2T2D1_9PROT|nr:enoyl-CoA hydratase/isomerase family protein [Azospirillum oleiclasticum]NYZ11304.1 enoyl-CoA hydratase/isomerase family protein [Azospirillum oleiclasticum]NYZ18465.1 enoyl-CoA hydratase/isomerase family protein [Azospirillum oleiclasticum]